MASSQKHEHLEAEKRIWFSFSSVFYYQFWVWYFWRCRIRGFDGGV